MADSLGDEPGVGLYFQGLVCLDEILTSCHHLRLRLEQSDNRAEHPNKIESRQELFTTRTKGEET